jgi:hypothetical protein
MWCDGGGLSQLVSTMWFYGEGSPGPKEIWLFAIVMM